MNSVVGYGRPLLNVEELLGSAMTWRRRDFADRSFVHALEHLVESCNEEADLSIFGVRALKIDVYAVESNEPTLFWRIGVR